MLGAMTLEENAAVVRERIARACERAGRSPDEVTLIAVTKGHPAEVAAEACRAGLVDLGENRVQEALPKIEALASLGLRPRWHLIGHLQTNKVKSVTGRFAILHSVDSVRLGHALSQRANMPLPVLLEVNAAQEASKHGFAPDEVASAFEEIAALPYLDVRGLMTVAPLVEDAEVVRPVFRRLRELRDELGLRELSMGMTDDFEVAIEEGSTMVRVGRALFGERQEA
jgi:pyridoxal phosphate enzyme (YggS family)